MTPLTQGCSVIYFFSCQKVLIASAIHFTSLYGRQLMEHFTIVIGDAMSILNVCCSYGGEKLSNTSNTSGENSFFFVQSHSGFKLAYNAQYEHDANSELNLHQHDYMPLEEQNCCIHSYACNVEKPKKVN